jgi:hypothetical protein
MPKVFPAPDISLAMSISYALGWGTINELVLEISLDDFLLTSIREVSRK